MSCYAAVDLGATNTRALVAGPDGDERGRARRSTPQADGATVAAAVVATLETACEAADVAPGDLEAVGVGSIGPLDADAGAVVDPPNVPAERIALVDALCERTDAPVTLENDAVAGIRGERRFTDCPENAVYLTLSTGVGAGVAVDDHVLRGRRGNAAEVGHLTLVPDGRPCGCGGTGHWEAYCSGSGIAAHARDRAAAGHETGLDAGTLDAEAVFEATEPEAVLAAVATGPDGVPGGVEDDPLATRVVADAVRLNARGVAALAHAYAPELVSIGGAVALSNPALVVDPLAGLLDEGGLAVPAPEVRATQLGEDAVLRGALASVLPE
ncbi:ROK family protein [Haloglomus halophilum]|uniref:ROK family protein n=1 Tax=Haloglomus halophilum TaxID=2962672 RepID=UPI0020C9DEDE|nr:ROK family protein [Haloglomus halophilum]